MELPSGIARGKGSVVICERESDLYQLGAFDIVPGVLVIEFFWGVVVGEGGAGDQAAWEFGVLSVWVCVRMRRRGNIWPFVTGFAVLRRSCATRRRRWGLFVLAVRGRCFLGLPPPHLMSLRCSACEFYSTSTLLCL